MVLLQKFVQENALNRTGFINYNQYGKKEGTGFISCSEKFVDNFLLYVLVPDYSVSAKNSYTEVGSVNKRIRDMLTHHGLRKCEVKAITLSTLQELPEDLEKVYGRIKSRKTRDTKYYRQEFKIACADEDYAEVLKFLRTDENSVRNIFLKDIDVTMEYSGRFDKEVVQFLTSTKGFRFQGTGEEGSRTMLDNSHQVGNNCLTYMETVDKVTTRCKIYNKMVQMLESKSVRDKVGQHWKDWVCQQNTRLGNARNLTKERGLTRAEVTFYCNDKVPSDKFMENMLTRITEYIPHSFVYCTPYADTWKAYCDAMLHSLIVIDIDCSQSSIFL